MQAHEAVGSTAALRQEKRTMDGRARLAEDGFVVSTECSWSRTARAPRTETEDVKSVDMRAARSWRRAESHKEWYVAVNQRPMIAAHMRSAESAGT